MLFTRFTFDDKIINTNQTIAIKISLKQLFCNLFVKKNEIFEILIYIHNNLFTTTINILFSSNRKIAFAKHTTIFEMSNINHFAIL